LLAIQCLLALAASGARADDAERDPEAWGAANQPLPAQGPRLAGADAGAPPPREPSPLEVELKRKTRQIKELGAGTLDTGVDPQSLFDVSLTAPAAELTLEARRLELILSRARAGNTPTSGASGAPPQSPPPGVSPPAATTTKKKPKQPAAQKAPEPSDEVTPAEPKPSTLVSPS
jgi:hypothetical protein